MNATAPTAMRDRFRGFLPVVVDVETGGLIARTGGLREKSGKHNSELHSYFFIAYSGFCFKKKKENSKL